MRFVGLASLVLATVLGASNASADFILLDNFNGTAQVGTSATSNSGTISGGRLNFLSAGISFNSTFYTLSNLPAGTMYATDADRLLLRGALYNSLGATAQLTATVYNGSDTALSSQTVDLNTLTGTDVVFNFAALGDASLQSIAKIDFKFTGEAANFSFDRLYAVPEPTTLALIGVTAIGGGAAGWRKRRAKAVAA